MVRSSRAHLEPKIILALCSHVRERTGPSVPLRRCTGSAHFLDVVRLFPCIPRAGVYIYADLRAVRGIWVDDTLDGVRHPVEGVPPSCNALFVAQPAASCGVHVRSFLACTRARTAMCASVSVSLPDVCPVSRVGAGL